MQDSHRLSVMDAMGQGGSTGVSPRPPASRVGWAMEKPWETPTASARAPAAAEIPTARRGAVAPLPLSCPIRGEALAGPADIPALPACWAGRSCEAAPGSSLSAPRPFAPSTAGLPAPPLASRCGAGGGCGAKPGGVPTPRGSGHRAAPYPGSTVNHGLPKKPHLWPCLPFPPFPRRSRVICILYVKEILLSPSPSPSLFW